MEELGVNTSCVRSLIRRLDLTEAMAEEEGISFFVVIKTSGPYFT
jgi:hypothetical protein